MSNIKVMNLNYLKDTTVVGMTKSSEIAAAPATNLYDRVRRTKVWRSAGYFLVTSSNKGIVLQEVAGVNQTVNIAEGAYASDAAFLTAVKAALDSAAGTPVYTVVRDTATGKIKVTSDLAGGAVFRLMCTNAAFTAASMLGFSTATDKTGLGTYLADLLRIHTCEFVRWDLGTASNPTAFALLGRRNSPIGLSATAVVKLQGNSTDVWTAPQYTETLTWNQDGLCVFRDAGLAGVALRYWRLYIEDRDNPNGYVQLSNAYLGQTFTPSIGAVQFPFEHAYKDYSRTEESDFGVAFSEIRQQTVTFSLAWSALGSSDVETMKDFVEQYGTFYPFFISLDPSAVFSSAPVKWVKLCRFSDSPSFRLTSPGFWQSTWPLREEV